jgi:hypothetical protein
MQTLIFNTTTKQVQLLDGPRGSSLTLETFENISTVKVNVAHYEVMQKQTDESNSSIPTMNSSIPVMRVPISNTNMIIIK